VALADTGNKLVGTFSSGMRQRLLIARSLLGNPRVLLLDEPTRSLDPISARDFRHFLRDVIVGEQGCTVLLATHDAEDVWNLCERVAVLHRGELLAVDRTETLRQRAGGVLYRIWSRDETLDLQDVIARRCGARVVDRENAAEQGWTVSTLEMDAGSGSEESAHLLRRLVAEGVVIARYERRSPDLADLLERVVAARDEPHA
jgi:ABC-2 type transport system ATP-binding protein